jgi:flavodoxin
MKTAIVYYSFEGNCALTARTLKGILEAAPFNGKADIYEIKTADAKKRTGFSKYVWGGSQVFMRRKPALLPMAFEPAPYDLIILGTPVWAGSPAPAMVSFLDKSELGGKRTALFCCHAGGKGKALEKFRALASGAVTAGELDLRNPASAPEGLNEKLTGWLQSFIR